MGADRDRRFAIDDEKRREQERKALRLLAELEQHEDEAGKATLVGFAQMSEAVGPAPGRSRAQEAFSALPWARPTHATFDDFRATGLREVLARLSDRALRRSTLASADRDIAKRVEPSPPIGPTPVGTAMWRAAERRAATLYRHAQDSGEVATDDPVVDEALARCGSGQALPSHLRAQMERELGISLARVRVHTDAIAAAAANAVRAHAFTVGEDIFFATGTYAPDSTDGRKLLAHELTHVAQAHQGRTSTGGSGIRVSAPGESLEREADAVAERVMQAPRRPTRDVTTRAPTAKARYAPPPSQSLLLRKAHARRARVADDAPFKEINDARNKTTWRLGDDDVFVCVSGPDGTPLQTTITVSAERNHDRWNALGKRWAAAAPGRTWPRPADGRTKTPKSSAPTESTHAGADRHGGADTDPDPAGTPAGILVANIGSAYDTVRSVVWSAARYPVSFEQFGIPGNAEGAVYLDLGATLGSLAHPIQLSPTISAPALRVSRFSVGPLSARDAKLVGLVMKLRQGEGSAVFTRAELDDAVVGKAPGEKIRIGKLVLVGGKFSADATGGPGVGLHFDEARLTGFEYPGAPPVDLVITNSTLVALESLSSLTASTSGGASGSLPTIPTTPLLAGTRVSAKLSGLEGMSLGPWGNTTGGFTHFEAKLIRDGADSTGKPPEPLASITLDGVRLSRGGATLGGSIKRVHVTGSADFVLALLDSPTVGAHKDVADAIHQLKKLGVVPTAGFVPTAATQLTLENVQLGATSSTATARTDIILDLDVPGSLKLRVEVRGLAMSGDPTAQTGHVDFGKVLAVLSDGKGPIGAIMAEGNADKGDKKLSGALRHLEATGDVSRITAALRTVKFPSTVDAVLATVKKHVSAGGALDFDAELTPGAGGKDELRGNAHARLEVEGVGSVDLAVVNFHGDAEKTTNTKKDLSGSLAFDRFEAHLTPKTSANRKATRDAAALVITGAHAATASGRLPNRASADMIDLLGDAGKAAAMVTAIHRNVASLPAVLQQAVKLVHTLDLGAASALLAPSSASPAAAAPSTPIPDANVTTNAHVALVIPRLGTIDATVRGFNGSSLRGGLLGDFESFEVALLTTAGKRAARLVVRGGSGWIDPGKNNAPADLNAQLDDVVIEGNSRNLLQALESHDALLASAPTPIRTGFEFLRAHKKSLSSTVSARATGLAVARIDGQNDVTAASLGARIAIPGGVATATMTKAELNADVSGFSLLEIKINDSAATLRIRDGQWTDADQTGTAASISFSGDGSKLLAILEPNIIKLLPVEIGTAIRKYNDAIVSATATNVSVRLTDDGVVGTLPFLDLNGSITFTGDGKKYTCQHASIQVYGAQVDGSGDTQTITADRARIEGHFETLGGRTMRGNLVVTTGAAKLTHGSAGSGLAANDIRARGWLDVGAGEQAPPSDHELADYDDSVATATNNVPAIRSLHLQLHAPLTPATYGGKKIRVDKDAALDFMLNIDEGMVTTIVAKLTGNVSIFNGQQIHRLALDDQKLDADITGWLGVLADALLPVANAISPLVIKAYDIKFDVASFVSYLAAYYRTYVVNDANDKYEENWADEGRIERDGEKAEFKKRETDWKANPNRDPADEPKPNSAIMKDLLNLQAISGSIEASLARPHAVGITGPDAVSGHAQIHGSIAGGKVRLDANASVDTLTGTAKATGVRSGDVTVSDGSTGGTMVSFDSFHVEQFTWDPAARAQRKPSPK